METLENGIYTEIPDEQKTPEHLKRITKIKSELRTKATEMVRKNYENQEKAMIDYDRRHFL